MSVDVLAEVRCIGLIEGQANSERVLRSLAALAGTVDRPCHSSYQITLQTPSTPPKKFKLGTDLSNTSSSGPSDRRWLVVADAGRPWAAGQGASAVCRPVTISKALGDASIKLLLASGLVLSSESLRQGWSFFVDTPSCVVQVLCVRVLEPKTTLNARFEASAAGEQSGEEDSDAEGDGTARGGMCAVPGMEECAAPPGPFDPLYTIELTTYVPEAHKDEALRSLDNLAALINKCGTFIAPLVKA